MILLFSLLGALSVSAFELEVDMAVGTHYSDASGTLIYRKDFWENSSGVINHDTETNFYSWLELRSDNSYLPTLRLDVTKVKTIGQSFVHIESNEYIDKAIEFIEDNTPIDISDKLYNSRLTQNTYEATLYYEFYKKRAFPSIGIGLGVKKFDFDYSATIIDGLEFNDNGDGVVPLLYLKSRYEIVSGAEDSEVISLEFAGKGYFGDSTIYDYYGKVEFLMPYNKTSDLGFELGYKLSYYDIQGEDIVNVGGDMQNQGIYFGFVGHFR